MNILVPLNNYEYCTDYINAGAKEFYLGFYDNEWNEKFGTYSDINRMSGYGKAANKNSFKEILNIISEIKNKKADIYITFNSSMYSDNELEFIERYFKKLVNTNVDGVILSCHEAIKIAKNIGLPVVVSTIAGIYNSDIVNFYKEIGAKRVILPRDLSILEIESIVGKDKEMEYEIFIMRNGCKFSDSNCLGFHRSEMCSICATLDNAVTDYYVEKSDFNKISKLQYTDRLFKEEFHKFSCGLCGMYDFIKIGINAGKIVGRSDDCISVCSDIKLIRKNIELAYSCSSKEEYLNKMIFPNSRSRTCTDSLSCYYPEIRF